MNQDNQSHWKKKANVLSNGTFVDQIKLINNRNKTEKATDYKDRYLHICTHARTEQPALLFLTSKTSEYVHRS